MKPLWRKLILLLCCGMFALSACNSSSQSLSHVAVFHNRAFDTALLLQGASSGDWPMFGYDPGHTGYVDPAVHAGSVRGKVLWSFKAGPVFSSPVAGLSMLFVSSTDGYLYALKQGTGAVVWRVNLKNNLTDATPSLEGQVLFVSTHSTAMEALNANTGQVYWVFETHEKIQAPPLVVGNRVLVASRTTVWALAGNTGQLMWNFHRGVSAWPTSASPTVAGNTLYIGLGSSTQFLALDLTSGHLLWSLETGDRITSTALVEANIVYV